MPVEGVGALIIASEWYQTTSGWISVIITSVGGGTVIAGGVASFFTTRALETKKAELSRETERLKGDLNNELERLKGEIARETEIHKTKMKRIEFIQNKEIEAGLEFMQIAERIHPKPDGLDADFYDACADVARRCVSIKNELDDYIAKNKIFVSSEARSMLSKCSDIAGAYQFEEPGVDGDVSIEAIENVKKMLEMLRIIENQMMNDIRNT